MYTPIQPGIPRRDKQNVLYQEFFPKSVNPNIVYCFWILHTRITLQKDFPYIVLPDGCVDMIFDTHSIPEFRGALLMTPALTAKTINLGRFFSYVGIRFQPGAWYTQLSNIIDNEVFLDNLAGQDLIQLQNKLIYASHKEQIALLEQFVHRLERYNLISNNTLLYNYLIEGDISSVEDLVKSMKMSHRHLQRILFKQVGYRPHDFLKIIRFQQALKQKTYDGYTDQSHYIREYKRITSMTPGMFQSLYDW